MANHMNEAAPTSLRDIVASSVERFQKLRDDIEQKIESLSYELNLAEQDLAAARTLVAGANEALSVFTREDSKMSVDENHAVLRPVDTSKYR